MEPARFNPKRPDEHARRVAAALDRGLALVPALGGVVALGRGPDRLVKRFGAAFRLVTGPGRTAPSPGGPGPYRPGEITRVLDGPVAVRLAPAGGWSGLAPAREPLLRAVAALVPDSGVGVPGDPEDADEIAGEDGTALWLKSSSPAGPGPTVIDFRARPATVDRKGALAILELEARLGERVRLGPGLAFSVLVVCTGNMCRSPMAHGMLERLLAGERVFVFSAGTGAPAGLPPTPSAVEAAAELGADITRLRAKKLTAEQVVCADLVLVMEEHHRERVLELVSDAAVRVRLLGECLPGAEPGRGIADPVGRPLEEYRGCAAELGSALERVAEEIRQRLAAPARPKRDSQEA
ncbi:MAG: hypothetical protein R6X12_07565 [bacterium]